MSPTETKEEYKLRFAKNCLITAAYAAESVRGKIAPDEIEERNAAEERLCIEALLYAEALKARYPSPY